MIDLRESGQPPEHIDQEATMEKELFQERHRKQLQQIERWYNSQLMVDRGVSRKDFYRWLTGNS
jgi:hypothetical protein